MGFKCGIVGLPNVGKSTIFNAMTSCHAEASNYPFCTIDPNVGIVQINDERLVKLAELVDPEKVVQTTVEFVDIAGLVKGASKGEGLGNQFLGHIRSVDALAHVVRCFDDPNVVHVSEVVDPAGDIETIDTELILADLTSIEKRQRQAVKAAKTGDKDAAQALKFLEELIETLNDGKSARTLSAEVLENRWVNELNLLTAKPLLYVANVNEEDLEGNSEYVVELKKIAEKENAPVVVLSGRIESEVAELPQDERAGFLAGLDIKESGLDKLARIGYELLGLITFFTAGKKEARAWTVPTGAKAPQAAGIIHTDFERGFIRAAVISYEDYVKHGSEVACKEKGLLRVEGRDYVIHDGDVIHFRFAV